MYLDRNEDRNFNITMIVCLSLFIMFIILGWIFYYDMDMHAAMFSFAGVSIGFLIAGFMIVCSRVNY